MVFRLSVALLGALVLAGVLAPDAFGHWSGRLQASTLAGAGWLYLVIVFAALVFLGALAFGRTGALRIGGDDAEPQFSRGSWFAMLFSAGMGIGLVFWGAAEPLSHYHTPPEGLAPDSFSAARAAMRYTFFHWGLHPWAVYGLIGLAMAWFQYNRHSRGLISDLLSPLIGRHAHGAFGHLVDVLAVVATAIGVATTLGFGAAQIGAGLGHVAGVPSGLATQLAVIAVAFVLYMLSTLSGLDRGIKWLSNFNLGVALLLLALVVALGPTAFVFETLTTTLGGYLNELPAMSLRMSPFSQSAWVGEWTIFYWAWWIAWAPFVGAFFARISYGRTVREFVLGVVCGPALVSFLWFSGFGGSALFQQIIGHHDLLPVLERGYEYVLFAVLEPLPFAPALAWLAIVLLLSFFVTSADSATLTLASMSSPTAADPPLRRKLVWGVLQAGIAVALLGAGGLDALQAVVIVAALPFALLLAAVMPALYRVLAQDLAEHDRLARELHRAELRWLAQERDRGAPRPEGEGGPSR
ncbi:BCCT family transporter [Vulcaniibacterium tengchongense]|uniref:Glycine betaine transporter n=1 Tax=Vulcaniibacterium tengchongense TaxID=1273429 RepID=A0A3N4VEH0_9GAMM|nr:BCCT family transporter [Vulcaniibacterium tengchongense]RPE80193.1 glycine betaine transporter [Vulcaniibacterium tengchongense]